MSLLVLTTTECARARRVGEERARNARARGRTEPYGTPTDAVENDCQSSAAELAAANYLGTSWEPLTDALDTDRGDVKGYQIRWTKYDHGRLLLHPADRDDAVFVLVTGWMPVFHVRGWLYARDGKRQEWWVAADGQRPAYFVPQSELRPMEALP